MKDRYDLCLKIYVLTLRSVLENFRKESGSNWGAMVRFIDVNFKLIRDIESLILKFIWTAIEYVVS